MISRKTADLIATVFNRMASGVRLVPMAETDYPDGFAAFRNATWSAYETGDWEWMPRSQESPQTRAMRSRRYASFLNQAWYEDGLMAWKNMSWRTDPAFVQAYAASCAQTGSDYKNSWRTYVAIWAARLASQLPGAFVEFGSGRGWYCTAILESGVAPQPGFPFLLFDTFTPEEVDPATGIRKTTVSPVYADGPETLAPITSRYPAVRIIAGDVRDTAVAAVRGLGPIAFAHFDLNASSPERFALESIEQHLQRGSVILLDDFGFIGCEEQHDMWNETASRRGWDLLALPTGQGLAIV